MGYNYSVLTCNYSVLTCNGPVRGHSNTVLLQWAGGGGILDLQQLLETAFLVICAKLYLLIGTFFMVSLAPSQNACCQSGVRSQPTF